MSYNTEAYDMDLHKLEQFIDSVGRVETYPRYIVEWMDVVESDSGSGISFPYTHEEWWSASEGDDLYEFLHEWEDFHANLKNTIYIDIYYQESEDTVKDYISRVYQHKKFTVEDIEKLI